MSTIPRLKKRSDFLRVAACQRKVVMAAMIVQFSERSEPSSKDEQAFSSVRVGFTASRRVGNAVKRNRARRRLRAVVERVCRSFKFSNEDLVVIARPGAVTMSFSTLLHDFHCALIRLGIPLL